MALSTNFWAWLVRSVAGNKLFRLFVNDHNIRIAMHQYDEFVKYGQYTALGFSVVFMAILKL